MYSDNKSASFISLGPVSYILAKSIVSEYHKSLHSLVDIVVKGKKADLEMLFYSECMYLPKAIKIDYFVKKITNTNLRLEKMSLKYKCLRYQEKDYTQENKQQPNLANFNNILIAYCCGILDNQEHEIYRQFEISDENLGVVKNWYRKIYDRRYDVTLPKFELITDYLAMMSFFDSIIQDFEDLKTGKAVSSPEEKYRFKSKLSKDKISLMYNLLIEEDLIDNQTDINDFLWVFGIGEHDNKTCSIKWDDDISLLTFFIEHLIETNLISKKNKWVITQNIFNVRNLKQSKVGYEVYNSTNSPKKSELIVAIVSKLL